MSTNVNRNGKITQQFQAWTLANRYWTGDTVIYNNSIYYANGDIAPNTAFETGTTGATWAVALANGQPAGSIVQVAKGGAGTLLVRTSKGRVFGSVSASGNPLCGPGAGRTITTDYGYRAGVGFQGISEIMFYDPGVIVNGTAGAAYEETGTCTWLGIQGYTGLALFSTGNLWGWGANDFGQLGMGTLASAYTTAQGSPRLIATNVAEVYTDASSVGRAAAGYSRTVYRDSTNGKIYGCGYNGGGQLGLGGANATTATISKFQELTWAGTYPFSVWNMGNYVGCLVVNTNTAGTDAARIAGIGAGLIRVAGYNGQGQLGNGTNTNVTDGSAVAANVTLAWTGASATNNTWRLSLVTGGFGGHNGATAYDQGTMVMWLTDPNNPTVHQIRTSGYNGYGQIGNNTLVDTNNPYLVPINGSTTPSVKQVSAIGGHVLSVWVLLTDGTMYNWGYNTTGQLGIGNTTDAKVPTTHATLVGIKEILFANQTAVYNDWRNRLVIRKTSSDVNYPNAYMVAGTNYNDMSGIGSDADTVSSTLTEMRLPRTLDWAYASLVYSYSMDGAVPLIIDAQGNWWAWGYNGGYTMTATYYNNTNVYVPTLVTPQIF